MGDAKALAGAQSLSLTSDAVVRTLLSLLEIILLLANDHMHRFFYLRSAQKSHFSLHLPTMFEEPEEQSSDHAIDPAARAKDKSDEFRMHAEMAAVFEGTRKFDAILKTDLDPEIVREMQRAMARLEKSKLPDAPILAPEGVDEATRLLTIPLKSDLSTNDYHVYRRPGEIMMIRWLSGDQIESFYERLQAHFDAALDGFKEEERSALEWKQDPKTLAYLTALDAIQIKMAERYLREPIRQHRLFVLSTQTADELSISYLCDYIMSVPADELVGQTSSPPDDPTEQDLTWFFKLFSLRGMVEGREHMCFFAFLQKADDGGW
jgi:hypothetical protein